MVWAGRRRRLQKEAAHIVQQQPGEHVTVVLVAGCNDKSGLFSKKAAFHKQPTSTGSRV